MKIQSEIQQIRNFIKTDKWLIKEIEEKYEELTNLDAGEGINKSEKQLLLEIDYLLKKSNFQEKEFKKLGI